jgi:hypothetical protein
MKYFNKRFVSGEIPSRLEIDVEDIATIMVHVVGGDANMTGFAGQFEGSLNSNSKETGGWFPVTGQRSNSQSTVEASVSVSLNAGVANSFYHIINVTALKRFRVRASALTTGNVDVYVIGSDAPTTFLPIGTINIGSAGTAASNLGKAEDATHASGDVGVMMLGVRAGTPSAVTSAAGDYGYVALTNEGKQIPAGQGSEEFQWQQRTIDLGTTDVAMKASAGAGLRNMITDIIIENTGAAACRIIISDGATAIFSATVPAGNAFSHSFKTPLKGSVATVVNARGAAATTSAVHLIGYVGI